MKGETKRKCLNILKYIISCVAFIIYVNNTNYILAVIVLNIKVL